jgi:uncharacterized lipoprotein YddW (UPF0748 family)
LTTPDDIDRCVDLATQARFHILFVQVRGRGDSYYQSSIEPAADALEYPIRDFDPLAYLLVRAHSAGISVHAWINVYLVWSNGAATPPENHIVRSHPDWLATSVGGVRMDERPVDEWKTDGVEGYFVSPFSAQARAHTTSVVRELIEKYAVDGIHLDYIRFPGGDYGFGPDTRTEFALEWGVDPVDLRRDPVGTSAVMGNEAAVALEDAWTRWRVQSVDSMVLAIRGAVGETPLSAAVAPDPDQARIEKGQGWPEWIHNRWVDFVVPMAYNYRPEELLDWVRILHNTVGREKMLVGLAIYGGRDEYIDRSVNVLRLDRTAGFSIFSYNVLVQRRFPAQFIENVFFRQEQDEP